MTREITINDIVNKIEKIAVSEEKRWTDKTGEKIKETESIEWLTDYWNSIIINDGPKKKYRNINPQNRAIASSNNKSAWSAAFICYVMRKSGVLLEHGFEYSRRHITYIVKSVMNREEFRKTGIKNGVFFYYDKSEFDENSGDNLFESICISDLICLNRRRKSKRDEDGNIIKGKMTNHTIRSLKKHSDLEKVRDVAHCDIVVNKFSENNKNFITTIGGNVANSVSRKKFEVKGNKVYLIKNGNRKPSHYFGFVRIMP